MRSRVEVPVAVKSDRRGLRVVCWLSNWDWVVSNCADQEVQTAWWAFANAKPVAHKKCGATKQVKELMSSVES
jgi:hypothetical protein